jgi:drug/metabolite transporter (DMT)-like permease
LDNVPRGILFVLASLCFFCALDTTGKAMTAHLDPIELAWGRYLFSVLLLPAVLSPRRLRAAVRTKRPVIQLVRSILLVTTTATFFTAVKYIPLADATAIGFVSPLLATAISIPILDEKVGLRRWSAIALGFVGVMIVLRPGFEHRHWAYFLPLGVATMMAFYNVLTRFVVRHDSADTSLAYTNAFGALAATGAVILVPGVWQAPDPGQWLGMAALGAFGALGHFCLILAYRNAPVSTLAPFSFTQMILAVLSGILVFGDWPDLWTLAGACIVAGSGVYVFRREALLARAQAKA